MNRISDENYRSHTLPCYPFSEQGKKRFIGELESRVVLAVSDNDYRLPSEIGYTLTAARLYTLPDRRRAA